MKVLDLHTACLSFERTSPTTATVYHNNTDDPHYGVEFPVEGTPEELDAVAAFCQAVEDTSRGPYRTDENDPVTDDDLKELISVSRFSDEAPNRCSVYAIYGHVYGPEVGGDHRHLTLAEAETVAADLRQAARGATTKIEVARRVAARADQLGLWHNLDRRDDD